MIDFSDYESFFDGKGLQKTIDNYGILNVMDYWFDTLTKTDDPTTPDVDEAEVNPFKLDNDGITNGLYNYFLNCWDVIKNIETEDENKIKAYYYASKDGLRYLENFNKTIIRKLEIKDNQTYKKHLTELLDYYTNRQDFDYVTNQYKKANNITIWLIKLDENGNYITELPENYEEEGGKLWNNSLCKDYYGKSLGGYKKVYCVKLTKEKINSGYYLNDMGKPGFVQWKKRVIQNLDGKKITEVKKTFYFFLSPEYYVDSNSNFVDDRSIIYELFSTVNNTFDSYSKNGSNFVNYYEEYFKQYFYKILLEKYRTKEIEEEFLKYLEFDLGYFKGMPDLHMKMNGKSSMGSFSLLKSYDDGHKFKGIENETLTYNQQIRDGLKIPFSRSEYENGFLTFYIEINKLPKGFGLIKYYKSIEDYLIFVKNFYLKLRNKTRKDVEFDEEKQEFKTTLKTIYSTQAEYIDEYLASIANRKLREMLYAVRPNFNIRLEEDRAANEFDNSKINNLLKYCNGKDFDVGDIIENETTIIYALSFFQDSKSKINYAKLTVSNKLIKDFEADKKLTLGGGYLNIQQKTSFETDNLMSEYSHDKTLDDYVTVNGKKYEITNLGTYNEAKEAIKNISENSELRKEMNDSLDFTSIMDDSEITIVHKVENDIGYKETKIDDDVVEQEWVYGRLGEDGTIEEEYKIPNWKKSTIYCNYNSETEKWNYSINFQNMLPYDAPETITQIKIIDYSTGEKYTFPVKGVEKRVLMQEDNLLELDNLFEFDKEYIANENLYLFIRDGLNSGNFKISKNSYGVNELVIQNETANYTKVVGDTLVVGSEYETQLGILTVKEDGVDGYYLVLNPKDDNSSTNLVYNTKFITKKRLVLKPYSDVEEYLNSIPKGGKKTVYIDSFIQAESAARASNLYIEDLN